MKRKITLLLAGILLLTCTACGSSHTGNTEKVENSENTQETETEKKVEIAEANDILTRVWDLYEDVDTDGNRYNDKFPVMGGHFESAVIDKPAKYDLSKTSDLTLMYCVAESAIPMLDDAATIVHLMKASTFTAGAYHVADEANMETVAKALHTQILENRWLDGFPDELLIVKIDEQYVVSAIGTAEVMDSFRNALLEVYGNQVTVLAEEAIR